MNIPAIAPDAAAAAPLDAADADRRFGGLARLYGAAGAARIRAAHVVVVGVGGVGSWAAEALARSGVAALTLVDLDHIAESNVNRQIHAHTPTLGQAKVEAMVRENVIAQLANIQTHPSVRLALEEGRVTLHGWIYDIESGLIEAFDGSTGTFVSLAHNPEVHAVSHQPKRVA